MTKNFLEVENLVKDFQSASQSLSWNKSKTTFRAVDNVSFTMEEGEILGVVGESGSGKSTLSLLLLRLIEPTSGKIRFFGKDILNLKKAELADFRKKAQIIFQDPFSSLNPKKNIFDIIFEGMLLHGIVKEKEEAESIIAHLLREVGLEPDSAFRYPHAFSGGQRQRIAIARALSVKPEFLICDEILSALDLSIQAQILSLLYELKKRHGLSLLFISHDLSTVERFCDRVLVFYRGKIVETGKVVDLFSTPKNSYTKLLLASIPRQSPREKKKI